MTEPIAAKIQALHQCHEQMLGELGKVIVGQREVLEELLVTIFAGGHNLLEGVPGLAKTLMISTLARVLDLQFKRIQFTPDLMPSDIVGTNIIEENHETGKRVTVFVAGPIFSNIVLADEINRTPPKTQAALLQAMQEREVTAGGQTHKLDAPFFVLATQNPIDQEGTYPLPEAQKDRFLMNTLIKYPKLEEEESIVNQTTMNLDSDVKSVLDGPTLMAHQKLVRSIPVSPHVTGFAVDLTRATRPHEAGRAGVHQGAGRLGRRPAREPGARPRREMPRRARRPRECLVRRRAPRRRAGVAPSPARQLHRRGGGDHDRQHRAAAPARSERARDQVRL